MRNPSHFSLDFVVPVAVIQEWSGGVTGLDWLICVQLFSADVQNPPARAGF